MDDESCQLENEKTAPARDNALNSVRPWPALLCNDFLNVSCESLSQLCVFRLLRRRFFSSTGCIESLFKWQRGFPRGILSAASKTVHQPGDGRIPCLSAPSNPRCICIKHPSNTRSKRCLVVCSAKRTLAKFNNQRFAQHSQRHLSLAERSLLNVWQLCQPMQDLSRSWTCRRARVVLLLFVVAIPILSRQ
jgi:hypothetical protein